LQRNAGDTVLVHKLTICSTCLNDGDTSPKGAALAQELRVLLAERDFDVETVECMNACALPTAISFRAGGKAAYLFAGIKPETDQSDIVAFADLYADAKDGLIEDARPCGRLRQLLVGRIPS
jgi:predicted metal-binding protein